MPEQMLDAILGGIDRPLADFGSFLEEWPTLFSTAIKQMGLASWISGMLILFGTVAVPFASLKLKRVGLAVAAILALLICFELILQFLVPSEYRLGNYGPPGVLVAVVLGFTFSTVVGEFVARRFQRHAETRVCWKCRKSVAQDASYCDSCRRPLAVGSSTIPEYLGYAPNKVLHRPICRCVKEVDGRHLEAFEDIEKARSKGYRCCTLCLRVV